MTADLTFPAVIRVQIPGPVGPEGPEGDVTPEAEAARDAAQAFAAAAEAAATAQTAVLFDLAITVTELSTQTIRQITGP